MISCRNFTTQLFHKELYYYCCCYLVDSKPSNSGQIMMFTGFAHALQIPTAWIPKKSKCACLHVDIFEGKVKGLIVFLKFHYTLCIALREKKMAIFCKVKLLELFVVRIG